MLTVKQWFNKLPPVAKVRVKASLLQRCEYIRVVTTPRAVNIIQTWSILKTLHLTGWVARLAQCKSLKLHPPAHPSSKKKHWPAKTRKCVEKKKKNESLEIQRCLREQPPGRLLRNHPNNQFLSAFSVYTEPWAPLRVALSPRNRLKFTS